MIRRRHSRSLARAGSPDEDVNPNSYVNNIADCMLVMALGFLVALIARYNVDLQMQPEEAADELVGVEVSMDADGDGVVDERFEQRGSVFYDSQTGNYYFVED